MGGLVGLKLAKMIAAPSPAVSGLVSVPRRATAWPVCCCASAAVLEMTTLRGVVESTSRDLVRGSEAVMVALERLGYLSATELVAELVVTSTRLAMISSDQRRVRWVLVTQSCLVRTARMLEPDPPVASPSLLV